MLVRYKFGGRGDQPDRSKVTTGFVQEQGANNDG